MSVQPQPLAEFPGTGEPEMESAVDYRAGANPVSGVRLGTVVLTVRLLADPQRAHFTFDCTAVANPSYMAREWMYDIPAERGDIENAQAWDEDGSLMTDLRAEDSRGTRLRIWFRRGVVAGSPYRFRFAYQAPIRVVATSGTLALTVAYSGWVIFLVRCDLLCVDIALPPRSVLLHTRPASDAPAHDSGAPLRYRIEHLRPLESQQWLVAYRKRWVGVPLYAWVASSVASALVGWLIARALDGSLGR